MSVEERKDRVSSRMLAPLLAVGLITVALGTIILFLAAFLDKNGSTSAAVIVFIGPFPIAFGSGFDSVLLILVGIIFVVTGMVLWMVLRRKAG
jgi:uncharacterized membrane protein